MSGIGLGLRRASRRAPAILAGVPPSLAHGLTILGSPLTLQGEQLTIGAPT